MANPFVVDVARYIGSGFGGIHIQTSDNEATIDALKEVAEAMNRHDGIPDDDPEPWIVIEWSCYMGFTVHSDIRRKALGANFSVEKYLPEAAVTETLNPSHRRIVFAMVGFDERMKDYPNALQALVDGLSKRLYSGIHDGVRNDRFLTIITPRSEQIMELRPLMPVLTMPLPEEQELTDLVHSLATSDAEIEATAGAACLGLSRLQAENVTAYALNVTGGLKEETISVIKNRKASWLSQLRFLRYVPDEQTVTIDQLPGFEKAARWVELFAHGLTEAGRNANLDNPSGIALVGISGSGKTQMCKLLPSIYRKVCGKSYPVFWVDCARLLDRYQGVAQENLATLFHTLESMKGCVAIFDEFEKAMGGAFGGSTESDGGTRSEIGGRLLQWLSEERRYTIPAVTMNSVKGIPPEFFRRFDAVFVTDLPNEKLREQILMSHMTRRRTTHDLSPKDMEALNASMDRFTGADIERVVRVAKAIAFADGSKVLKSHHFKEAVGLADKSASWRFYGNELDKYMEEARSKGIPVFDPSPSAIDVAKESISGSRRSIRSPITGTDIRSN